MGALSYLPVSVLSIHFQSDWDQDSNEAISKCLTVFVQSILGAIFVQASVTCDWDRLSDIGGIFPSPWWSIDFIVPCTDKAEQTHNTTKSPLRVAAGSWFLLQKAVCFFCEHRIDVTNQNVVNLFCRDKGHSFRNAASCQHKLWHTAEQGWKASSGQPVPNSIWAACLRGINSFWLTLACLSDSCSL